MGSRSPTLKFVHGDMLSDLLRLAPAMGFDGILCRSVLNDLIQPGQRQQAFSSFAQGLRDGGLLLFDVRESRAAGTRHGESGADAAGCVVVSQ
jgi:chemotaxis methyl-accepting protein methylase